MNAVADGAAPPASSLPQGRRGLSSRLDRLGEGPFAAVLAAPGLLLVLLIVLPPLIAAIAFSFFRIELSTPGTEPFVALRNYVVRLPADAEFLGTLPYSVAFAGVVTLIAVPVALGAALLVHSQRRFGGLLALLLILPWAVAPIGDGLLWRLLLDPSYGLVGKVLGYAGLPALRLYTPEGATVALVIAVTWRAMPLLGILFLGGLRQVPADLGRAARMDGASAWQAFRRVTLPIIWPTVVAATLIELILALQVFDIQFALTSDAPPLGTELVGTHIFHSIMGKISLGYGATETMVLALLIAIGVWLLWVLVVRRPREADPSPAAAIAADESAEASRSVHRLSPAPLPVARTRDSRMSGRIAASPACRRDFGG